MKRTYLFACLPIMLFAAASTAVAQSTPYAYIASTGNVSLSSAATAATLQQPATFALPVSFPTATTGGLPSAGASVYCSVACTATITRDSVAATATAGTVVAINPIQPPAVVTFYTASNYSGGVTLGVINVGAGATVAIDLSGIQLPATNSVSNLTIAISSITGTANITFYPIEKH